MSVIDEIKQAGREKKLLKIQYRKVGTGELSERIIEVYELKSNAKGHMVLWAWDIATEDHIRQFILVGILSAEVLEETFVPRNQWPVKIT